MPDSPELAAFKERLWNVTTQTADNNGWCGVWRDAMHDLGVGPPHNKEYLVSVTYKVTAEAPDTDAVRDALRTSTGAGGAAMSLDHAQVRDVMWAVENIHVRNSDDGLPF